MKPAAFLGAFASPADLPPGYDRRFVCVGRSNVGKSSFVNALTGTRISRTSATPGRTQTINAFAVAPRTMLVDLPGYGFAKQSKSQRELLESRIYQTLTELRPLTRLFLLIDANVGLTALDQEMLAFLQTEGIPFTILANKADKLNQKERAAQERLLKTHLPEGVPAIFCSTLKETGLAEVRNEVFGT